MLGLKIEIYTQKYICSKPVGILIWFTLYQNVKRAWMETLIYIVFFPAIQGKFETLLTSVPDSYIDGISD